MFEAYPKTRPALPQKYKDIYELHYRSNRNGSSLASGLSQRLEAWMHRRVADDVALATFHGTTLEIGAGTLNHLAYEPTEQIYDAVEPAEFFYRDSPNRTRIRRIFRDIAEIELRPRYNRIISVAAFEHIRNLPEVVARSGLLLNDRGCLRVGIPSEGTALWTLAQTVSTGLEFRLKYRLDYSVLSRHEHINSADEIEEVLSYFFRSVDSAIFGISRRFSLYRFYVCGAPHLESCFRYLAGRD